MGHTTAPKYILARTVPELTHPGTIATVKIMLHLNATNQRKKTAISHFSKPKFWCNITQLLHVSLGDVRLCTVHPGSYSRRCIKDDVPTRSILCSFRADLLTHTWVLARSQRENTGLNLSAAGKKPKSTSLALNGRG